MSVTRDFPLARIAQCQHQAGKAAPEIYARVAPHRTYRPGRRKRRRGESIRQVQDSACVHRVDVSKNIISLPDECRTRPTPRAIST